MTQQTITTSVGVLQVRTIGAGPPVVLWHSLFMDERSWERVEGDLASERRLVSITGPGHGRSSDPGRRYTMEECADAAQTVLDALGVQEPVDWIGSAWGGHVGIIFAATRPTRCRTLVTVGTPVPGLDFKARAETIVLVLIYRLFGATGIIQWGVIDTMLSPRTRAQDPDAVRMVRDALLNADRRALTNAVVSISLRRPDLTSLLFNLEAPTLFITGADHEGWTSQQAQRLSAQVPNGSWAVVDNAAYLAPLEAPKEIIRLIREFWSRHATPAQQG